MEVIGDIAARPTGQKRDRPTAFAGILHEQCLAERLPAGRKQRIAHLFDAAVDGLHDRDAAEQVLPKQEQPLAEDVGGEHAGDEHHDHGEQRAETRDLVAEQRLRLILRGQEQQRLVHRAHD